MKRTTQQLAPLLIASAILVACQPQADAPTHEREAALEPTAGTPDASSSSQGAEKMSGFDINSVPMSTMPLGEFPYFTLASGCTFNTSSSVHANAPFWTGHALQWVEGKTVASYVSSASGADCGFSNVVANMDAVVRQAHGVKVNESQLTRDAYRQISADGALSRLEDGLQGIQSNPIATWLIRQPDRQVWIQLVSDHAGRAYNILLTEAAAATVTAQLLPASELKQQLEATGKVALHVNFATDKTQILPESLPQIDQVLELLQQDDGLKLSIEGHTDNTGRAEHNRQLSEGRARSVVAALEAKGIDASRLSVQGFGDTRPVADNATEAGRAQNRRVELVKQ